MLIVLGAKKPLKLGACSKSITMLFIMLCYSRRAAPPSVFQTIMEKEFGSYSTDRVSSERD